MKRYCMILVVVFIVLLPVRAVAAQSDVDGQYTIEVTLSGGTGRASITSPTTLTISEESITATIVWSSPHYEYMLVKGIQYDPIQTEGNSTFEIPVTLDENMAVSAQTVAMSQPHLIDYVLYFDSSTIKPQSDGMASWLVTIILVLCIALVLFIYSIRRKRRYYKARKRNAK